MLWLTKSPAVASCAEAAKSSQACAKQGAPLALELLAFGVDGGAHLPPLPVLRGARVSYN